MMLAGPRIKEPSRDKHGWVIKGMEFGFSASALVVAVVNASAATTQFVATLTARSSHLPTGVPA